MNDINFFSVYKRKRGKNKGFKIFIVVFLLVFFLSNSLLVGYYLLTSRNLQDEIDEIYLFINDDTVLARIEEAKLIKQEEALTTEYLQLLSSSVEKLDQMNMINSSLLDKVRSLTPSTTFFSKASYSGNYISLECRSSIITDPMDMYHAFLNDITFIGVSLSGISIDAQGNVIFNLYGQFRGGESR